LGTLSLPDPWARFAEDDRPAGSGGGVGIPVAPQQRANPQQDHSTNVAEKKYRFRLLPQLKKAGERAS
jgi:hypothetical protein